MLIPGIFVKMQNHIFLGFLFDNVSLYFVSLFLSAVPMYFIASRYSYSWIDPLRISLIFSALANAPLIFLYLIGQISDNLFYYSIAAILLFWSGFLIPARNRIVFSRLRFCEDSLVLRILFFEILFLYGSSYIFSYIYFGIPIFASSRIGVYIGSGGYGVISRVNPFLELFILMYSFMKIGAVTKRRSKLVFITAILVVSVFNLLSGSRMGLINIVVGFFGYSIFWKHEVPNDRRLIRYAPILLAGTAFVLLLMTGGNSFAAMSMLLVRIVASGDAYYMAYPNDVLNFVDIGNGSAFLLSQILVPLRLVDGASIPLPIGVQLKDLLYPEIEGLFVGPNSLPPILGYALFGYAGIFFTFCVGMLSSLLIFRLSAFIPRSFVSSVFVFYMYFVSLRFIGDPTYGIASLFDAVLNVIVLIFLLIIAIAIRGSISRSVSDFPAIRLAHDLV